MFVLEEAGSGFLEAIAVAILKLIDVSIIAEGEKAPVRSIDEIVDIIKIEGQFAHRKTGHEHLNGRRISDRDQEIIGSSADSGRERELTKREGEHEGKTVHRDELGRKSF